MNEVTGSNNALDILKKATDIEPILESLSRGAIVRNVIGRFVQCCSVVLGLVLLVFWGTSFATLRYISFLAGLGVLIWQVFFVYASYLCLKTIFLRGKQICNIPDSAFTIAPIVATFMTLVGETTFIFLAVMSLPAMLMAWLAGSVARGFTPLPIGGGFLAGPVAFILFWIIGFLSYVVARWLQEWTLAIFSIAQNVDLMRRRSEKKEDTAIAPPAETA